MSYADEPAPRWELALVWGLVALTGAGTFLLLFHVLTSLA